MHQRLPELFRDAANKRRDIVVVTSGKDRAVDSGYFFTRSLAARQAGLESLLTYPASLAPRAPGTSMKGGHMERGVNRMMVWESPGLPLLLGVVVSTSVSIGLWLVVSYISWFLMH